MDPLNPRAGSQIELFVGVSVTTGTLITSVMNFLNVAEQFSGVVIFTVYNRPPPFTLFNTSLLVPESVSGPPAMGILLATSVLSPLNHSNVKSVGLLNPAADAEAVNTPLGLVGSHEVCLLVS